MVLKQPWARARWNALLLRVSKALHKGYSPEAIRDGFQFSPKRPKIQLRGRVAACDLLLSRDELAAAKPVADEISALTESSRIGHQETVGALHRAAEVYSRRGDLSEATAIRERILVLEYDQHGPEHELTVTAKERLASDLCKTGRLSRAIEIQREVVEWWQVRAVTEPSRLASIELGLGISLMKLGDTAEARQLFQHAVDILGAANPESRLACSWLASALSKEGELDESLRLRERTLTVSTSAYGPEDRRTLDDADAVAASLWRLGLRERARAILEGSLASRERVLGDDDPDTQRARQRLSALLGESE